MVICLTVIITALCLSKHNATHVKYIIKYKSIDTHIKENKKK
jgi:hypothetical protein